MKKYALLVAVGVFGAALSGLAEEKKNLINNPGFERGKTGWKGIKNSITLNRDVARQGMVSLKFTGTDKKKSYRITSSLMKIDPSKKYRLSFYIKSAGTDNSAFSIAILPVMSTGRTSWMKVGPLSNVGEKVDGWIKKEVILKNFSSRAKGIRIYPRLKGTGIVFVDDFALTEVK